MSGSPARRPSGPAAAAPWRRAARAGGAWGAVAVFVAIVGMVEAFAGRHLVEGALSLGVMLLVLSWAAAGYQTANGRGRATVLPALFWGLVAGAVAGAAVSALLVVGRLVDLRQMFVNASPVLFLLLSFGQATAGTWLPVAGGALAGVAGAALAVLPAAVRRPLVAGLVAVLTLGLFQEMLQGMLVELPLGDPVRGLLFAPEALSALGALGVFAVAAVGTVLWTRGQRPVREAILRLPPGRYRAVRALGIAVLLAVLVALPQVAGPFLSHVLVIVGLYVLMGLGLNLEVGFAGLLDLGFVAFFAIGAYTVGLLTTSGGLAVLDLSFWAAVPIAVVISLAAGVILGVPVLRIRGDYLAIATLGFGEIIRLLVLSDFLRPWLGGSQGVLGIPKPVFFGIELATPERLFYLTLIASALVAFVAARLRDSRLGRAWMALREDEDVAEAMGIDLVNVKLLAYGLGAAFAGVSGAIFAVMVGSVFPHSFQLLISINVLALIIVGGMGSMPGVVVGALFLVGLPEILREFADFRFLVYGAALVLMMQLRPEGLWPAAAIRRELRSGDEPAPVRS